MWAFASARRKRNFIKRLKDDSGNWLEGIVGLNSHTQNYFTLLFRSEVQQKDPFLLQNIQSKDTKQTNTFLMAPYNEDGVKNVVFRIGELMGPG